MTPQDFPILKNKFVMVDLETLSTRPNAAIVSIGACKFTFQSGIIDEFKVNINAKSCKDAGLHICKDTLKWWGEQPKEARIAWQENDVPLSDGINMFLDWWGTRKDLWFVCNGMSFDSPILSNSIKTLGLEPPWKYRNELDLRTIYNLFNVTTDSQKTEDMVYHDALVDAKFQTNNLLKLFDYEEF